jgi:serine/threonine-protein kinase
MTVKQVLQNLRLRAEQFSQTPEGREWTWYGLCYGGLIVFLALILLVVDLWIMPRYVGLDNIIKVPNVVGMSYTQAYKTLEEAGLSPRVRSEVYNNAVPAGYVTSQLPYPTAEVKPDRSIYLDLSKGKQLIEVPNLIGLNLRDARLALLRANGGLELNKITYNYDERLPPDIIASQSVTPKTKVAFGTMLDVVVSLGAKDVYVAVPNLEGKTLEEAQLLITGAGLSIGNITYGKSETFGAGVVFDQIPPAGDSVKVTTPIHLTISR